MKQAIGHFDYHVVDACNLACDFCTHYSNFKGPAGIRSPQDIESEWSQWKDVISPERVHLIGGEPLLNPNIVEIVCLAFSTWTEATICLYSNGLLLHKHPGLKGALRGGRYIVGLHYGEQRDAETEMKVRDFFGPDVSVDVIDGSREWLQFYKFDSEGKPIPYSDGNQRASWECCIAGQQRCYVMKDGRLWKCPQVAFADRAGVDHWFDGYQACYPNDDIAGWLSKEDEACCSRCPSQRQFTKHGSDHMNARLPLVQIT